MGFPAYVCLAKIYKRNGNLLEEIGLAHEATNRIKVSLVRCISVRSGKVP